MNTELKRLFLRTLFLPDRYRARVLRSLEGMDRVTATLQSVENCWRKIVPLPIWETTGEKADREQRHLQARGTSLLPWIDPEYPEALAAISSPPALLLIEGSTEALSRPSLTIVGSRRATYIGLRSTTQLATALSEELVVVSGGAYGVDAAAHWAAIENGRPTIAVVGCGLDVAYPSRHRDLFRRIVKSGGALISEYPLGSVALPHRFHERNRLLAGLSPALLIIEAAERSGTLVTARHALDQGKEIFVLPWNIDHPNSRGILNLLRDGATPVLDARTILDSEIFRIRGLRSASGKARVVPNGLENPALDHR